MQPPRYVEALPVVVAQARRHSAVATTNGTLTGFPKGALRRSEIALEKFAHAKFYLRAMWNAV